MAPRCTLCELHTEVRSVLIPYRGKSNQPDILFVGVAPAREEDRENKNFVGPSGKMLFQILHELGIDPSTCAFDNVVHCAPLTEYGKVKDATPEQISICSSYLYWKIKQTRPKIIVTLGNVPSRELINPDSFISSIRGGNFNVTIGGDVYTVVPTFHPSSVLHGDIANREFIKNDILHAWRTVSGEYWLPKVELVWDTREVVDRIIDIGDRFLAKKIRFCAEDNETNSLILGKMKAREEAGVELVDKMLYSNEGKIVCKALATVENVIPGDEGSYRAATGFCFPCDHKESTVDMVPVKKALRHVYGRKSADPNNIQVPMAFHNHKYDGSWDQEKHGYFPELYHDSMLGHLAIYGNSRKHGLENILFQELLFDRYKGDTDTPLQALAPTERHYGNLPMDLIGTRCAIDTVGCGILSVVQRAQIRQLKRQQLSELVRDASVKLAKTELRGNFIDVKRWKSYMEKYPVLMQQELDHLNAIPQVQVWCQLHPTKKYKPNYYEDRAEVMYRIFKLPNDEKYTGDKDARYKKNDLEKENPYWSTDESAVFMLINHCRKKEHKEQIDPETGKVMMNEKGLPIVYEEYVPAPFTGKCDCRAMDERLVDEDDHTVENYKRLEINPHGPALDFLTHNRQYSKIKTVNGNYLTKMERFIRPDEWHNKAGVGDDVRSIMYSYLIHYVASGRMSIRDFPTQTIPWHGDPRRCFVSKWHKQGGLLLSSDYSQAELRLAAALGNDPLMIQAYKDGKDLHRITASSCWQVPQDQVTSSMRRYAKTISFRILYGAGARSIALEIGMTTREVQKIIDNWMETYAGVANFIASCHNEAMTTGQVISILGLVFDLPDALIQDDRNGKFLEALRQAQNLPIQSSSSYVTLTSFNMLWDIVEREGMKSEPWLMVHDANEMDVYPSVDELYLNYQYSKHAMEVEAPAKYPWLNVPMKMEAELGARWDGSPSVIDFTPERLKVFGRVPFVMELVSQLRKFSEFKVVYHSVRDKKDINHSSKLGHEQMVEVEKGEEIVMKKSYEGDSGGNWDTGAEIYFKSPLRSADLSAKGA
jgi:uracil-DNA glycosylase family 4